MYGELANKLIEDARRTSNLERLPLYQGELIRALTLETRDLLRKLDESMNEDGDESDRIQQCSAFVYELCIRRNKRCLLAYSLLRTKRLDQLIWSEKAESSYGGQNYEENDQENLGSTEQEYLREMSDLIVEYKGEWTDIDLTGSLEPPKEMYVEVRVLQDAGEIQTEYGVFNLTKDSQFFARLSDVQRLIQQGLVQLL